MSFLLYVIGFLILIAGVAWGLDLAGVPHTYILVACVILLGIGVVTGVTHMRPKDRT